MSKAEQMLKFPLVETFTKDGQTIVVPARWDLNTISRMTTAADKLARMATDGGLGDPDDIDWMKNLPEGITPDDVEMLIEEWAAQVMDASQEIAEQHRQASEAGDDKAD